MLTPQGAVPLDALDQLVTLVRTAEASPLGEDMIADAVGLADLMQRSGVKRLDPAPQPRSRASTGQSAPARSDHAPLGAASPLTAGVSTPAAPPPPRVSQAAQAPAGRRRSAAIQGDLLRAPSPSAQLLDNLKEQLDDSRAQIGRLEARVAELTASLGAEQARGLAERRQTADEHERLGHALKQAQDELADSLLAQVAAPSPPAHVTPAAGARTPSEADGPDDLAQHLRARGLLGDDEANNAVRALLRVRRWAPLARELRPRSSGALRAILQERLLLHCRREGCPEPPGVAAVRVSPERCEICGGGELERSARRLGDAMLLNGLRRLLVLGGPLPWGRLLTQHIDRRVELTWSPPTLSAAELSQAQVVVAWREASIPALHQPDVLALTSQAPSLAGLAEEISLALAAHAD